MQSVLFFVLAVQQSFNFCGYLQAIKSTFVTFHGLTNQFAASPLF